MTKQDKPEPQRHPSYGMVRISRASGGKGTFFGSDIPHQSYVRLELTSGCYRFDNHAGDFRGGVATEDYGHRKHSLVLGMTASAFARLLVDSGGSSVPCTVMQKDGVQIEPPPPVRKRSAEGAREHLVEASERCVQLVSDAKLKLLADLPASVSKSAREQISAAFNHIAMEVGPNLQFAAQVADEMLEQASADVKADIDLFAQTHTLARQLMTDDVNRNGPRFRAGPEVLLLDAEVEGGSSDDHG